MQILESRNGQVDIGTLLAKLHRASGYDFRDYKPGTIMRRLERRLQATGTQSYPDYMRFLDSHQEEYERLAASLTISVSDFFRHRYAFDQVARVVLPELLSHAGRHLRFWSAACARGQEAYSIAITLAESLGEGARDFTVYASDINRAALMDAEIGRYSPEELAGLPPGKLKYFTPMSDGYLVNSGLRERVRFSFFDLNSAQRPPFAGVDCIFCCNVLIYLKRELQHRLLARLYESLATPGYLVLGEVETLTEEMRTKLECLDNRARIYRKCVVPGSGKASV